MLSVGALPSCDAATCTDVTITLLILNNRNSPAALPALRVVSVPSLMCLPVALNDSSSGDARSTSFWIEMFSIFTRPAPPPPPPADPPSCDSPQLQASTSISPLCLASVDSPSMPASLRHILTGTASPPSPEPDASRRHDRMILYSVPGVRRRARGAPRQSRG